MAQRREEQSLLGRSTEPSIISSKISYLLYKLKQINCLGINSISYSLIFFSNVTYHMFTYISDLKSCY